MNKINHIRANHQLVQLLQFTYRKDKNQTCYNLQKNSSDLMFDDYAIIVLLVQLEKLFPSIASKIPDVLV